MSKPFSSTFVKPPRSVFQTAPRFQRGFRYTVFNLSLLACALASASMLRAEETSAFWTWTPTPPMGWNSYDAWGGSVNEVQVPAHAEYMKDHLLSHGWNCVVIDFRWYDSVSSFDDRNLTKERTGAQLFADKSGRLTPAEERFPSAANGQGFKPRADQIHAMRLKFGFHMMRGIPRQAVGARTPIEGSSFTAADAANSGWSKQNPIIFLALS